jgi:surface antigen
VALASGGCSMSYQLSSYDLGSMFGGSKSDAKSEANTETRSDITGSITPRSGAKPDAKTAAKLPPEDDLAYAKAAVSKLLALGGKHTSLPWENPATGARGTITPITSAYNGAGGQTCRDFLASHITGTSEAWLQGAACKHHTGPWQVRSMKPWKSS